MKKIFSLLLIFAVSLLTITTSASANDTIIKKEKSIKDSEIVVSEREIISLWLSSSDEELEKAGYNKDQIAEIRSYNFEELFLERASLTVGELKNYGYSSEQINILKSYDGSTITANSPVLLASSDMTILFTNSGSSSNTSSVYVNATWEWSIVPLIKLTDVFAVTFKGVNNNGVYIDVTPSTRTAKVKYYVLPTGIYSHTSTISGAYDSIQGAVTVNIPMTQNDNYYWAKAGTLELKFTGTSINYVNLGAAYGHKTLTGTVSVSVSSTLSIDFTPKLIVSKTASASGRVTSSGIVSNY